MKTLRFVSLWFLSILISCHIAAAAPVPRPDLPKDAEIVSVRGEGQMKFVKEQDWRLALQSQALTAGDTLKTGALGKLDILFIDGSQIKIHHKTVLMIKETRKADAKRGAILGLEVGEVWSRTKSAPEALRIETPSATAAIRGTDWDLLVDDKGACYLTVLKGTVELFNPQGTVTIGAGEQAMAEVGKPPVKMFLVRPKDRVQWIISYPIDIADAVSFQTHRRPDAVGAIPGAREKATTSDAKLILAELLYDVKEREESIEVVNDVLASEPRNSRGQVLKGYLLLGRGETGPAEASFRKALENSPQRDMVLGNLGLSGVYLQIGEIGKAEKIIESLDTKDALPEVGVVLAQFRAFQGNFSGAIRVCANYAERFSQDERFPVMMADFLTTLDEPEKAEASTKAAFAINANSSMAWTIAGRQQYLKGSSEEAEKSFRRAVEGDPANTLAMSELGKLLMEKGHFAESEEKLSSAIKKDPGDSSHWSRRGMLMNWIEKLPSARADLGRATELNVSDYQSFNGLGLIALKEGRTKEAVEYFRKAGIMEPNFAEPHIFLAIAYYQLEEIDRAVEELKVAELLDPKDPVPHIITYIIYQDTYRPFDAVVEATKALELLPNLKSVNPAQDTKRGLSNLGSALLGLGMDEWASSYAEESFDIFDSAAYRFVANRFADNRSIYLSAYVQSFLLNPMSIGFQTRYQNIVLKPQHNFLVLTKLGFEGGHAARSLSLIQDGYFRKPFEIDYLLELDTYKNDGYRGNGQSRGYSLTYAFGARPDYQNGFFLFGAVTADKVGEPGPITQPDNDDYTRKSFNEITAGYNRRFGPKKNLLLTLQHAETKRDYYNPDPLGDAGLHPLIAAFAKDLGYEGASHIFTDGVSLYNDPADILGNPPFSFFPIMTGVPSSLDTKSLSRSTTSLESTSMQLKYMTEINADHQVSFGLESLHHSLKISDVDTMDPIGSIPYGDVTWIVPGGVPSLAPNNVTVYNPGRFRSDPINQNGSSIITYLDDRWRMLDNVLVEAGLFLENYQDQDNGYHSLNPRAGISWKFNKNHILRAAFQRRLIPLDPTMAPFTTAGLGFEYPRGEAFPGDVVTDYQASMESKWTDRIYTECRAERRLLRSQDIRFHFSDLDLLTTGVENRAGILLLAVNAILTDHVGIFARYRNMENKNTDGAVVYMPFAIKAKSLKGKEAMNEPHHMLSAGIVWVSPRYMKAALTAKYLSAQYADQDNLYKMPSYWSVDMNVTWELFRKHLQISLNARNIFDSYIETSAKMPGPGRSFFITLEYRF
ncbi:MAG: TonB-dependent receptor [Nitrospirae bacterium]|nr:TonB-dependent receptor [Nitrospirota bacterium]